MNFSSLAFLFLFLPITVILYQCIPAKGRYPFLILVSFFFCAVSGPLHAIVLLGSVFVNYILGFLIAKNRGQSKKAKLFLTLSIIINVAFLAFFKYSGLFVSTFSSLTGIRAAFSVALPLGISFYTFHAISFAVDVYRGAPLPGVLNFTTYMVLFPKLIQGPDYAISSIFTASTCGSKFGRGYQLRDSSISLWISQKGFDCQFIV